MSASDDTEFGQGCLLGMVLCLLLELAFYGLIQLWRHL